jgi:beta-phosphoglucomutase
METSFQHKIDMAIELIIFDLDGVIVDTAKFHYQSWRSLANELDFDFSEEQNERLKGVSRMDSLNIILEIGGISRSMEEKQALAAQKNREYQKLISGMKKDDILPGVIRLIDQIEERGIKLALGSASKNARSILKYIELYDRFPVIIDGTVITKAKPDPQVFTTGADEHGVHYENVLVIEDSVAGVQAAKKAGMLTLGIGDQSVLSEADWVIPGFEKVQLSDIITRFEN